MSQNSFEMKQCWVLLYNVILIYNTCRAMGWHTELILPCKCRTAMAKMVKFNLVLISLSLATLSCLLFVITCYLVEVCK